MLLRFIVFDLSLYIIINAVLSATLIIQNITMLSVWAPNFVSKIWLTLF